MPPWNASILEETVLRSGKGLGFFILFAAAAIGETPAEVALPAERSGLGAFMAPQHESSKLPQPFAMPDSVRSLEFVRSDLEEVTVYLKRDRPNPAAVATLSWVEPKRWGDAITMDPFVVVERTKVDYVPPPHRNRVIEAIKSGKLWKRVGRVVTSEAITRIEADAGGYGRLTVRIGFSW